MVYRLHQNSTIVQGQIRVQIFLLICILDLITIKYYIVLYKRMETSEQITQLQQHLEAGDSNNKQIDLQIETLDKDLKLIFKAIAEDIRAVAKINNYYQQISLTSAEILQSYRKILECNEQLLQKSKNGSIIKRAVLTYFSFLSQYLKAKDVSCLDVKGRAVWYLQIQIKLHCCLQFLHTFKQEQDITNSPVEAYAKVWDKIHVIKCQNAEKLKKEYKSLKRMLHIATSASIHQNDYDLSLIKKIVFGLSFPRYLIMNDQSKLKSFLFYRSPTVEIAQKIWNIPNEGATKQLAKITFEGIKTNIKIYIPGNGQIDKKLNIFQQDENNDDKITVRILYSKKLILFPNRQSSSCCMTVQKETRYVDSVIVHMHGGGFIALSSRTMQNYTRRWANALQIPIISIDYRMPPKHRFPQAPLDCLTVYRFIVNHIHNYMNIKPTNIYLAGDSAGGNLACSLTGLILKHKLPIPKGIYPIYPATDIRFRFSYSRLNAISDPLLWPPMLLLCLSQYTNNDISKAQDPLASPILFTEQYVNGTQGDKRFPLSWPKTVITVGNRDPLYDDSLMLMQKMVQSNIDCQCYVYEQLSHGYLSLEKMIGQCQMKIKDSIQHLKKLIDSTAQHEQTSLKKQ